MNLRNENTERDLQYREYAELDFRISKASHEVMVFDRQIAKLDEGEPKEVLEEAREGKQAVLNSLSEIRKGNKHLAVLDHLEIPKLREELIDLIAKYNDKKVNSYTRRRLSRKADTVAGSITHKSKRYAYYVLGILGHLEDSPVTLGDVVPHFFALNEEVKLIHQIYEGTVRIYEQEVKDEKVLEEAKKALWQEYRDTDMAVKKDMLKLLKEVRAVKQAEVNRIGINIDIKDN